ncbi:MAG TPA: hypothetical protein DGB32_04060 [Dehalococcoidia bacterium]|nr:hypothetical protein [Chloroflexota bacterium]HCV27480.1 hypothetical protein [Dehalococcoidia bacterium]
MQFNSTDLGKWETPYLTLTTGERHSLTPEGVWMIGDKPGLLAIFDDDDIVYVASTKNLAKLLQSLPRDGAECEMRTLAAIVDLGVPFRTAAKRASKGPTAQRVTRLVNRMTFSVAQVAPAHMDTIRDAFIAIADPRYNGRTSLANQALDRLPR